mmetsp:Transcript_18828/g.28401  ORF Transcript_18828/g.28401 Transcript_18828/m.28401 type:complete len:112 (+) Transcript_18828:1016-1351(+)
MNVAVVRDFQRMSDISRKVQERFKDHPEIVEAFTKVVINAHAKVSPPDGPAQLSDVIATLVKMFEEIEEIFSGKANDLLDALIEAQPNRLLIKEARKKLGTNRREPKKKKN